jgi:hypothetical protein
MSENEKKDKAYEVVHAIALHRDGKTVLRNRGEEVRASELSDSEITDFVKRGILLDPESPITAATSNLAHEVLLRIAERLGLLKRKGASYVFASKKVTGIDQLRKAVSLQELEEAIVAAATKAETPAQ